MQGQDRNNEQKHENKETCNCASSREQVSLFLKLQLFWGTADKEIRKGPRKINLEQELREFNAKGRT